ncbi:hypothetical protein [Cohnella massiliensis]|uniref:hypothetical protein n=1 Tax=Paenibacillaceae TaxID=186822 RepID=UPI0009BB8D6F|nr:hypothetical protein [Cohnella massiliensis]
MDSKLVRLEDWKQNSKATKTNRVTVKHQPPPKIKISRRSKHEEWVRSWRRRIGAARERGRERRRLYWGKPLRIYDVAFEPPEGGVRIVYVEGVVDAAGAIEYVLDRYEVVDIVKVFHTGYLNPPTERPDTMPDGRPKMEVRLDDIW